MRKDNSIRKIYMVFLIITVVSMILAVSLTKYLVDIVLNFNANGILFVGMVIFNYSIIATLILIPFMFYAMHNCEE